LSDCYHLLENWGFIHPRVAWPKSKEYAAKAISIDDSLAEAHTSMAMALAILDWDWGAAEEEYRRALSLNPSYVTAHHWYSTHFLVAQRRLEEAVREMEEAHRLDPFSPVIATNLGRALFLSGRAEDAKRNYALALELNPNFAYAHVQLGMALLSEGSTEEGSREIEAAVKASPDFFEAQAALANVYARAGRTVDAKRILQALQSRAGTEYVPATWIGVVCGALGELDQAFEWLEKAADDHSSTFPEYYTEPMFDSLNDDPRFGRLLGKIGLR
jgi:Tfp pilus assembly protein PilF